MSLQRKRVPSWTLYLSDIVPFPRLEYSVAVPLPETAFPMALLNSVGIIKIRSTPRAQTTDIQIFNPRIYHCTMFSIVYMMKINNIIKNYINVCTMYLYLLYTYTYNHMQIRFCIHTYTRICIFISICICIRVCLCKCIYKCRGICVYRCISIGM